MASVNAQSCLNEELLNAADCIDGKLDYLICLTRGMQNDVQTATREKWRTLKNEAPKKTEPTTTRAAMHSRYVLVRKRGRYFVGQLWTRLLDGSTCWIPAYTHERVPVEDTDQWMPLEEVG